VNCFLRGLFIWLTFFFTLFSFPDPGLRPRQRRRLPILPFCIGVGLPCFQRSRHFAVIFPPPQSSRQPDPEFLVLSRKQSSYLCGSSPPELTQRDVFRAVWVFWPYLLYPVNIKTPPFAPALCFSRIFFAPKKSLDYQFLTIFTQRRVPRLPVPFLSSKSPPPKSNERQPILEATAPCLETGKAL